MQVTCTMLDTQFTNTLSNVMAENITNVLARTDCLRMWGHDSSDAGAPAITKGESSFLMFLTQFPTNHARIFVLAGREG
jgi:hypothetical protein